MTRSQSRNENASRCSRFVRNLLCAVAVIGLSAALDGIGLSGASLLAADVARASDEDPMTSQKNAWQSRYRRLLQDQARLRDNAEKSRENYSRARRRNYPRGGARQQYIIDAEEAERDLVKVEEETMELLEQARRDALPRHWIFEVEDEDIQAPAATATTEPGESGDDGRNPLYRED